MKHHTKTMQDLDESLKEANRIKRQREKQLHSIKLEVVKMRLLLRKMNIEYDIRPLNQFETLVLNGTLNRVSKTSPTLPNRK